MELRGLRKQVKDDNFLHQLLDCRWKSVADRLGFPVDIPLAQSPQVCTDVRQHETHQKRNGRATLMTKSLLYVHAPLDRTLAPEEAFIQQGWGTRIDLGKIGWPWLQSVRDFIEEQELEQGGAASVPSAKRRKYQKRQPAVPARALSGASITVADMSLFAICGILASESPGMFENPPPEPLELGVSNAYQVKHEGHLLHCRRRRLLLAFHFAKRQPQSRVRYEKMNRKRGIELSSFSKEGSSESGCRVRWFLITLIRTTATFPLEI